MRNRLARRSVTSLRKDKSVFAFFRGDPSLVKSTTSTLPEAAVAIVLFLFADLGDTVAVSCSWIAALFLPDAI